jgi:hypothetical protein
MRSRGNLTRFQQLFEVTQIFSNGLRWFAAEQRSDERPSFSGRWRILQMHAELRATPVAGGVEVHGARGHHIGTRKRSPSDHLVLDLVDDLGIPFNREIGGTGGNPVRLPVGHLRHPMRCVINRGRFSRRRQKR